ncbi:beta-galactosidase [Thiovibrio frasassiensis]|uniref:Beta-galactosidase n=1 Tax=Thiovibrio frasassiensis TaxID=2984131 RepID=A0A9X4MGA6_9BACT|nr:beta-galactosidase [Thiovibrio frasassiensis]MDG4474988.1 beta-galactosidase [Thiovibrio frasassiensis]
MLLTQTPFPRAPKKLHAFFLVAALLIFCLTPCTATAGLTIRQGYFWDTERQEPFIPHGFAYQVWNPPVFATQTLAEVDYDLEGMQQAHANSLRVELVWESVEPAEGVFRWDQADHLIKKAEQLGLKLFILIGYQYPPSWFVAHYPEAMARTVTGPSPLLNYSHPQAKESFARFIAAVCARYKASPAIGGWIIGNEFAFYDLWENKPLKNQVGYDEQASLPSYRTFLAQTYGGSIERLNTAWGTTFRDFSEVPMARSYPEDRTDHQAIRNSGYHDLIQWRKQTIADFLAAGAKAAKSGAPNQLISYSMVGGIFNGLDPNYTGEDPQTITERCRNAGAPLDFISLNLYAWALAGHELRSLDFGIAKYRDLLDIPVLITETGHSSTETLFPGAAARQTEAIVSSTWEALLSGAMGVQLFHWSDRNNFLNTPYPREAGFGVVDQERRPKPKVYEAVRNMFQRMDALPLARFLVGSQPMEPDILVYWPKDLDLSWNKTKEESASLWGGLRRLGFRPKLINHPLADLGTAGMKSGAKGLLLPRNYQMRPEDLAALPNLLNQGMNIHANLDLPGQFDANHRNNPRWATTIAKVFGVDVSQARPAWESGTRPGADWSAGYAPLLLKPEPTGILGQTQAKTVRVWKYWLGVRPASGGTAQVWSETESGLRLSAALVTKEHPMARTAINTFGLGDFIAPALLMNSPGGVPTFAWDTRTTWLGAIYKNFFAMSPRIELKGPGANYVLCDLRQTTDGYLLALMNEHTEPALVSVHADWLLGDGTVVKDLLSDSNGAGQGLNRLILEGDGYLLFHITPPTQGLKEERPQGKKETP